MSASSLIPPSDVARSPSVLPPHPRSAVSDDLASRQRSSRWRPEAIHAAGRMPARRREAGGTLGATRAFQPGHRLHTMMAMPEPIPTSKDVVKHLNRRFEELGLPYRIEHIAVLPYVNPMWLANWEVPQLEDAPEQEIIQHELTEARWKFPQVMDEY
jgi:hypothetical protein